MKVLFLCLLLAAPVFGAEPEAPPSVEVLRLQLMVVEREMRIAELTAQKAQSDYTVLVTTREKITEEIKKATPKAEEKK